MAISVIVMLATMIYSSALTSIATAMTFAKRGIKTRSFCSCNVLRGILLNGAVLLDALVIHSKGDCDKDQEGQEKTCAAMKHAGEVDLLFRMI